MLELVSGAGSDPMIEVTSEATRGDDERTAREERDELDMPFSCGYPNPDHDSLLMPNA